MIRITATTILLILLQAFLPAHSQKKVIDLTGTNSNPGFLNPAALFVRWTDDSHFIISRQAHPDSARKMYLVDAKTGVEVPAPANSGGTRRTSGKTVIVREDDLFLVNNSTTEQLTKTKDKEVNPVLSPDSNYVAFTRNNNLYTISLATKKETQLTRDGSDVILNGYASWVYMEEILGRATAYKAFWWSPDSKHIAFFRFDDSKVPVFTITDGTGQHGFVETQRYPKSGDPNPEVKVGVVHPDGGKIVWADFNEKDDQYFGTPYWRPDGKTLWVQWMNRGQNQLKIYEIEMIAGKKKEIYNEQQKTWISLDDNSRLRFLSNNKGFILMSDQSGWKQAYLYDMNGKLLSRMTNGAFNVSSIRHVDEKNRVIYFTGNKEHPNRNDLYRASFDGRNFQRLTFGEFNHIPEVSPNGSYFVTRYSNVSTPTRIALLDSKGKVVKELDDSKGADFANYEFGKTQMVFVKSEDGKYNLPMRITWPLNMEPGRKYPVAFSVYGGPGAQSVTDSWSYSVGQQKRAADGVIQVSIDHRGSGEFGKEGENYLHRNLGFWEMQDWIQGVKWLRQNGADPERVFISGFSYGGYITAYALTYGADYFTHGVAGGSVTDWSLYDTHYTERYMDTPAENPEGYKSSSVLTHANKLKGKLMIVHGSIDDNVHVQNSVQLVSKLQDLNKDFEMMFYPGNRHGIGGAKGAHYQKVTTDFFNKYVLRRPM